LQFLPPETPEFKKFKDSEEGKALDKDLNKLMAEMIQQTKVGDYYDIGGGEQAINLDYKKIDKYLKGLMP
jgi:phosphoribosylformylglycinamidine (FGAM) synthase PurS component